MPEEPNERLTFSVGRQEFEELIRRWSDYQAAAGKAPGQVDPINALRLTGGLLRSLEEVLASLNEEATDAQSLKERG
ncbi:hypothetical protein J2Y41_003891 [Arthrobacter sp. 1088]|nr:hypothetical protein [Arthrobacter sp. 1088]